MVQIIVICGIILPILSVTIHPLAAVAVGIAISLWYNDL